ncbi:hypothetical protein EV361DRAFT_278567 [Lentinula raphanica]|uniref:BTB domain-containing protein n=1 Tax=Lentinula raphanica TaxID=153919 RepID=A0AA38UDQ7_9AGAR|nr:hypothetical protein F5878DRAFT_202934 [Lentinula raphanica]KAJ3970528.1 hypothetical protein EV361DRAFT_278567 [Lentinula raphanica]
MSSNSESTVVEGTLEATVSSEVAVYEIPPCEAGDSCDLPTDIVLRSSDGIRFGAHSRNLEIYSDGFPKANSVTHTAEDVELPEDSDVVSLLLKFMHHQPQPDLELLASKLLIKFANAAEKYGIYCATGVCKVMIGLSVEEQPFEVFLYAQRHGYTSIMDKAGKLAITQEPAKFFAYAHSIGDTTWRDLAELETHNLSTQTVFDALKEVPDWPPIFGAWFLKREHMRQAIFDALRNPSTVLHKGGMLHCADWYPFLSDLLGKMATSAPTRQSLIQAIKGSLSLLNDCNHCGIAVETVLKSKLFTLEVIAKKPLSSFLEGN